MGKGWERHRFCYIFQVFIISSRTLLCRPDLSYLALNFVILSLALVYPFPVFVILSQALAHLVPFTCLSLNLGGKLFACVGDSFFRSQSDNTAHFFYFTHARH